MLSLVALTTALVFGLLVAAATRWIRGRFADEAEPAAVALDVVELIVVAGITIAGLVFGGDVIVDPSRWAAAGSIEVQLVVAVTVGYLVAHLAGILRLGGARSLQIHHVVLIVAFSFTLAVEGYHGYVLVTLLGTATSMIRDLTGLARRGYITLHRQAAAITYALFESIPAIAIPVQFFGWEIPAGRLPVTAAWVGGIAFPIVAAIGLFSVAQVLRRMVGRPPVAAAAAASGARRAAASASDRWVAESASSSASRGIAAASGSLRGAAASGRLREVAAASGRWLAEAAASSGSWLPPAELQRPRSGERARPGSS